MLKTARAAVAAIESVVSVVYTEKHAAIDKWCGVCSIAYSKVVSQLNAATICGRIFAVPPNMHDAVNAACYRGNGEEHHHLMYFLDNKTVLAALRRG